MLPNLEMELDKLDKLDKLHQLHQLPPTLPIALPQLMNVPMMTFLVSPCVRGVLSSTISAPHVFLG